MRAIPGTVYSTCVPYCSDMLHTRVKQGPTKTPQGSQDFGVPLCALPFCSRESVSENCDECSVKAVSKSMPARHGMPRMRRRRQPPPTDPHPAPTRTPQLVDPGSFAFITAHLLGNGGDTTVHQVRMHLHVSTAIQTWILHVSPVRCTPSCIASECCPPLVNSE